MSKMAMLEEEDLFSYLTVYGDNSFPIFIKAHATVPITVSSCLSAPVEQFEVSL